MKDEDEELVREVWKMFFDGASNIMEHDFNCTNNLAEYETYVMGLQMTIEKKIEMLEVYRDSTLIIYQLKEAASYASSIMRSVVCKFIKREIIYRYRLLKRIISDNASNLNNKMMKKLCAQFKIKHHHSTPYRPKMNDTVLMKIKLDEAELAQDFFKQLNLIEEKRLLALNYRQMYQKKIMRAHDKKIRPRYFCEGELVLKRILPYQHNNREKWTPN
ncbi:uncharacterized protein LOC111290094 [Durio zibethinus]|uniref:Uncharacterized protein LOC111290094 n=1 Tax=Durio zibethinus TaxID=66656 RepID=A0A6P5YB02_DURZI|nr:uncharacterized protein LOC111290094 [Durio zibethinus]